METERFNTVIRKLKAVPVEQLYLLQLREKHLTLKTKSVTQHERKYEIIY